MKKIIKIIALILFVCVTSIYILSVAKYLMDRNYVHRKNSAREYILKYTDPGAYPLAQYFGDKYYAEDKYGNIWFVWLFKDKLIVDHLPKEQVDFTGVSMNIPYVTFVWSDCWIAGAKTLKNCGIKEYLRLSRNKAILIGAK